MPSIKGLVDDVTIRPGTIAGIIGPEGSGKTSLMAALSLCLHDMGWDVYAFPGFQLLKKGRVISKELQPEDWVSLPMDLKNIVIDISEADTHFDSLESWSTVAKMMRNLAKQRRKRGLTILYDVQDWSWFNNRLRGLTHIIFQCWDMFWSRRQSENPIPRGTEIVVTPIDCKGFYTGRPWASGTPMKFNASKIWKNFDTLLTTSPYESAGATKLNIKRNSLDIVDGVVMQDASIAPSVNMKAIEKLAEQYGYTRPTRPAPQWQPVLEQVISTFRSKGRIFPAEIVRQAIEGAGIRLARNKLGEELHKLGVYLKSGKDLEPSVYIFPE